MDSIASAETVENIGTSQVSNGVSGYANENILNDGRMGRAELEDIFTDTNLRMSIIALISNTNPVKELQEQNLKLAKKYIECLSECYVFKLP